MGWAFVIKKIAGHLLYPLSAVVLLLVVGTILLWRKRTRRLGRWLVTVACVLTVLLSIGPVAGWMLQVLEWQHPPLTQPVEGDCRFVVVLGGAHKMDSRLAATSKLNPVTLARLVEGIRQLRRLPDAKLIVSGGAVFGITPNAEILAEAALDLGVEESRIIVDGRSKITYEEAVNLTEHLGTEPFVLVTSASHMVRAMCLFRKQGPSHLLPRRQTFLPGRDSVLVRAISFQAPAASSVRTPQCTSTSAWSGRNFAGRSEPKRLQ